MPPKVAKPSLPRATGKTDDGVQFAVPETHDLVHNLTSFKFNLFEYVALALCWSQLGLLLLGVSRVWLVLIFLFWRAMYNAGLGWLLHKQSNHRMVSAFLAPFLKEGSKSREFLRKQITMKMGPDYDFDAVPIDYNVWLLFRFFVDLVLWNDFTGYFIVAMAFWEHPSPFTLWDGFFHVFGLALCVLCYFIKVDAIRVVGDFAWYWGDFFFLVDSKLTFDGVFQMAPHPMYSIGYLGFYGVSIMSRSYAVLYISLAAHVAQFLFLLLVENPHIERTYNSLVDDSEKFRMERRLHTGAQPVFHRDLIVLHNLDLLRSFDLATCVVVGQSLLLFLVAGGSTSAWIFVAQAIAWRVFHSGVLGYLLHKQSKERWITKYFVKRGGTRQEAFKSWKQAYNLSLTMTHLSFILAALKLFTFPSSLLEGWALLKITLGVLLIALHSWSSREMFEVIREFGWFYGDFFLEPVSASPEYTGIYRFVNNPEKVLGQASFYGIALIADSWVVFGLALFSHISMGLFLEFVENPHMRRLYGDEVRQVNGLKQAVKSKLQPYQQRLKPFKLLGDIDRIVGQVSFDTKRRREEASQRVQRVEEEIKARIDGVRVAVRTADLLVSGTRPTRSVRSKYAISVTSDSFEIGQPIAIDWKAPAGHPAKDWIGIYPVGQNRSPLVTIKTSHGKWSYLSSEKESGTVTFTAARLPWCSGSFEARFHYDGNHGVLAVSEPFEIVHGDTFPRPDERLSSDHLQALITSFFQELLERPDVGPRTDFDVSSWQPPVSRAVTEFLESSFAVAIAPDVLRQFNTPSLLALWVEQACEALWEVTEANGDTSMDTSPSLTPSPVRAKGE